MEEFEESQEQVWNGNAGRIWALIYENWFDYPLTTGYFSEVLNSLKVQFWRITETEKIKIPNFFVLITTVKKLFTNVRWFPSLTWNNFLFFVHSWEQTRLDSWSHHTNGKPWDTIIYLSALRVEQKENFLKNIKYQCIFTLKQKMPAEKSLLTLIRLCQTMSVFFY